jgi:hypothetical protein
MKAFHLKTAILAVAISALGYWSCQKDAQTTTQNAETTTQVQARETFFKVQEPANVEEIKQKISSFRNRIIDLQKGKTSNKSRENDDLSIDGVEWGLEAILNATYAHADFPVGEQSVRETKITVPTENGQLVDDRALLEAYEQAYKGFLDHYNSLDTKVRVPILIDIEKVERRDGNRSAVATYTMTTVYATSSYTSAVPPNNCNVFTSGSDWQTASVKLGNEINARKPLPYGHAFFVSTQTVGQFHPGSSGGLNPDLRIPGDVEDNYRDYSFFLNRSLFANYNANKNLSTADMNWYYCSMISSIQQYAPSGKILSNLLTINSPGSTTGIPTDNGLPKDKHVGIPIYGISMTCSGPTPCSPTLPIANCYNC